jgi:hypothetical protein
VAHGLSAALHRDHGRQKYAVPVVGLRDHIRRITARASGAQCWVPIGAMMGTGGWFSTLSWCGKITTTLRLHAIDLRESCSILGYMNFSSALFNTKESNVFIENYQQLIALFVNSSMEY